MEGQQADLRNTRGVPRRQLLQAGLVASTVLSTWIWP
jgi:hypothetical protein